MPLNVQVLAADPFTLNADVAVVGLHEEDLPGSPLVTSLSAAFGSGFDALLAAEEFTAKKDQRLTLPSLGNVTPAKVVLLGLGPREEPTEASLRRLGAAAARIADKSASLVVASPVADQRVRFLTEGVALGAYRYTKFLTGERRPKKELAEVRLVTSRKPSSAADKAVRLGLEIAEAVSLARDLQNDPPNELTPDALANVAAKMAKKKNLACKVWDFKKLQADGMKLIVAVGQGSANKPRMVHLTYTPEKKAKRRVVFVGKGLTFDSGGLCIKPAAGMGEMKTDMSGAANVVGLMAAVAALQPNVEVHGIIACAENMPDGDAYRPGDVFGSLDGKTVEIINTDAEGRLVLADALTYASGLSPDLIVDNATLTGACVVALGNTCSGFYATDGALAATFAESAAEAGEQFWHMPLLEDLREQLRSDVADLKHTGDRFGGSISAALFLKEFVGKDIPWIHCDIAGPALATRAYGFYPKGGTGHGVLTFLKLLEKGSWGTDKKK